MREYTVLIEASARDDVEDTARYLAGFSREVSEKWVDGVYAAMASLSSMPARYGRAREAVTLDSDLRQLLYRSHRIVFRIEENAGIVRILYVVHAARRTIGEPEKPDEDDD